jgi:hypothetical protein
VRIAPVFAGEAGLLGAFAFSDTLLEALGGPVNDRRAHPRVKGPFEGFWDGSVTQVGRIVDLSVGGCFVESVTLPSTGRVVTVSLAVTGGQINLSAEVLYVEPALGFAVRFVDMPEQVANVLRKEISNQLPH